MAENKKVILIPHCVLTKGFNNNTTTHRNEIEEIIKVLLDAQTGIIQLPCPHLFLKISESDSKIYSATKENNSVDEKHKEGDHTKLYEKILSPIISEIKEYKKQGIQVVGLIGIKDSPDCSVNTSNCNEQNSQRSGAFIEILLQKLNFFFITINMADIKMSGDSTEDIYF